MQRWNEASERDEADGRWGPDADRDLAFPDRVAAACGSTVAQVQRTIHPGRYANTHPTPGGASFAIADGEFSNRDQYLAAIRAAREYVYLENQAISVRPILEELSAAVKRGVAVVLVSPTVASSIDAPADPQGEMFGTNAVRWRGRRISLWQDWPGEMPMAHVNPFTCMPNS